MLFIVRFSFNFFYKIHLPNLKINASIFKFSQYFPNARNNVEIEIAIPFFILECQINPWKSQHWWSGSSTGRERKKRRYVFNRSCSKFLIAL